MKSLIIGETSKGTLSQGTLEIAGKLQSEGLDFHLVVIGSEDNPKIGGDTFNATYLKINSEELTLSSVADNINKIIKENSINMILASSTYIGRDITGFLSVDLNSSPVSNVVNFTLSGDDVMTTNSIDGGESEYITKVTSDYKLLIIRPKSFEPAEILLNENYESINIESNELTTSVYDVFVEEKTGPQLDDSKIVISAGRGMVDVDNLKYINELALKLNAAIGGTRAIVDAGWMPYSQQVGQTGKTVKPDVYIACGISGATQHQVGMKDSKYIIAINKDEEAPIFQIADLGIVGDTLNIIPKLIENL
jgi:electron transfer flavoprotein alpha subunit|tara:strand:- start:16512 stop:17435 length:924 start_codon:yes stop_codon:yes gene_type:complete